MFPEQLISSRNLQTLLVTSCFFFFFFWRCLLCLLVYSFLFLTVLGLRCCVQPLLAVRRGYSFSVAVCGLTAVASLAAEHVLWVCGLRSCGTWALAAPWHVGSSQNRDRTCFPCTGRQILIHWSTREFSTPCPFHTYLWLSAVSLLTVWALLSASQTCEGIPPRRGLWSVALMQTCRPLSTHCVWMASNQEMCSPQSLLSPGTSILMDLGLRRVSSWIFSCSLNFPHTRSQKVSEVICLSF